MYRLYLFENAFEYKKFIDEVVNKYKEITITGVVTFHDMLVVTIRTDIPTMY